MDINKHSCIYIKELNRVLLSLPMGDIEKGMEILWQCYLREGTIFTMRDGGHGYSLAKGAQMRPMLAELCGRVTGYCRGRGGSMHIADVMFKGIKSDDQFTKSIIAR